MAFQPNFFCRILWFSIFLSGFFVFFGFNSFSAFAQMSKPASLILNDTEREHFLSPYLSEFDAGLYDTIETVEQVYAQGQKREKKIRSIVHFGFQGNPKWFVFETINRSQEDLWFIDFGDYFSGRFGVLSNIEIYLSLIHI